MIVLVPPLLTMRLFAEERRTGTLEMLLTAPVGEVEVVLAKFGAGLAFYAALWVPSLLYLATILLVMGLIANVIAQVIVRRFDPLRGART